MEQDIVAQLPGPVAVYKNEHGGLPDNIEFEPGYLCKFEGRYFIQTRATLPLKSIDNGVGFGLWVEVDESTFSRYTQSLEEDELYKDFKGDGTLANEWPGFQNMYGVKVTFRTIKLEDKIYITEVHDLQNRDPLFYVAMTAAAEDVEKIEMIKNLVQTYIEDFSQN